MTKRAYRTVSDGGEGFACFFIETLVTRIVVDENALVGVLPALAVDRQGGGKGPVLIELPLIAHTDLESSHKLRRTVVVGRETTADLELYVLGLHPNCGAEHEDEDGYVLDIAMFHRS